MDALIEIFGGGALGGIVGAIASIFKGAQEAKQKKAEMDHEFKMAELGLREQEMQGSHELAMADKGIERAKAEGDVAIDIAETGAFRDSIMAGMKSTGIAFVDAVRGLIRPIITVYMLGLATYIAINISIMVGGFEALERETLMALYSKIIDDVMFLTMAAVLYWFGSRPNRK